MRTTTATTRRRARGRRGPPRAAWGRGGARGGCHVFTMEYAYGRTSCGRGKPSIAVGVWCSYCVRREAMCVIFERPRDVLACVSCVHMGYMDLQYGDVREPRRRPRARRAVRLSATRHSTPMAQGKNKRMSKGKKGGKKKAYVVLDAMRARTRTTEARGRDRADDRARVGLCPRDRARRARARVMGTVDRDVEGSIVGDHAGYRRRAGGGVRGARARTAGSFHDTRAS